MSSDCVPIPQMEVSDGSNRRQSERIPVFRPVELRTSDGWDFSATCTDVNLSGIGIDCERVLRVGQRLELRVPGKEARVPMLVIYRMGNHYGLSALASLNDVIDLVPTQA